MGNSYNITDTDSRLLEGLSGISNQVYESKNIGTQISNAVEESMITVAVLVKYYPALNKCMVKLGDGSTKICTVSLLMAGDIMFFYTPMGDATYCDKLHEPCVIPRGKHYCFVAPVNNIDEWVMLGYHYPEEFIGFNPSKKGQFKIIAFGSLGEYSIRFGVEGMEIVSNGQIVKSEIDDFGEDVSVGYYSKEDIDDIITGLVDRVKILEDKLSDIENASSESNASDENSNTNVVQDEGDNDG